MTGPPARRDSAAMRGGPPPRGGAIYGREPELRAVVELVRGAVKGRSGALLIEGELGAGKSLLLSYGGDVAKSEGVSVAAAAADELSRYVPLGPVLMALGESPATLADEAGLSGQAWLVESVRIHLEKRLAVGPLLVSLDDLHWTDLATLNALRALPGQLASRPLAWIFARRPSGPDHEAGRLFDLLESDGARRISLAPLADDAAAEMITDALGAVPDSGLLALAADAAGNPLLLAELVRGLQEEDAVEVAGGRACLRSAHMPRKVHEVMRNTLDGLAAETRHLLDAAAVLGRSFRLEDAATMLGTSAGALLPAVDEAQDAGVIIATADALTFRHELVRQAVLETVPLPVRQALDRQIGEDLLAGGSAASGAGHLLSGARRGDAGALAGLDRAGAEVLRSSPAIAADLAMRALDLTPPGDPGLTRRSSVAAEALAAAGRPAEAARLTSSALAGPLPAAASARLRCALSAALWMGGRPNEALIEAVQVLAHPRLPDPVRADVKIVLLQGLAGLRDNRGAAALAQSVLAAARQESSDVVVTALVVQALVMWDRGALAAALDLVVEAARMATGQRPDPRHFLPDLFLASRMVDLRRFEEARSVMNAAADRPGLLWLGGWAASQATLRARMSLADGRLDDAFAEAQAGLGAAIALGSHVQGSGAPAILATVALRRGDLSAAARHLQSEQAPARRAESPHAETWDTVVAAQIEDARGGRGPALERLVNIYAELDTHRFLLTCEPTCAAWLARTALAAGNSGPARSAALAAADISRKNPELAVAAASAAHAEGLVNRDPGRLEQAASGHSDPWARASAAEDLGALLAAAGSRDDAITRLDQAAGGYEATGADRDAARTRRRLRRLGVRRRHWSAESKPATGWPSLTATECTVAELAAQGLTNQQVADQMFVSIHTVAFHLRQVFRKLGISSRVELARIAVREQPPQEQGGLPERTPSYPNE
jgi:DNA-binding CsgD family transcriptional regulator